MTNIKIQPKIEKKILLTRPILELSLINIELKKIKTPSKITLYVYNSIIKKNIPLLKLWERRQWKTTKKKDVDNKDVWREFFYHIKYHNKLRVIIIS